MSRPLENFALVLGVIGFIYGGFTLYAWNQDPDYDEMKQATLDLQLDGEYICSAVAVSDDLALTAGHCVGFDGNFTVVTPDGQEFEVRVGEKEMPNRHRDTEGTVELQGTDIAVLHLKPTDGHPAQDGKDFPDDAIVEVVCREQPVGTDVFVVGSPRDALGGQIIRAVTQGRVITTEPRKFNAGDSVWLQHDAVTWKGNSGGPIFNRAGDLIGITSHGNLERLGNAGHNFGVAGETLCQVLERQ